MKVLIVASGNYHDPVTNFSINQAFIFDQIKELEKLNIDFDLFLIQGKGIIGYLRNILILKRKLKINHYNIVHAHYGTAGLLALLSGASPLVITFHGSDLNKLGLNIISSIALLFCRWSIIVSDALAKKRLLKKANFSIIPCGLDLELFKPKDKEIVRRNLEMDLNKKYILFASSFSNPVKNFPLAKKAIEYIGSDIIVIELQGKKRHEVCDLLNAADLLLLCSFSEGSPQVIKEAMACNCPIVSTDVGDVVEVIENTEGCFISTYKPDDLAEKIRLALEFSQIRGRTDGRRKIGKFDNRIIAIKISDIYKKVVGY